MAFGFAGAAGGASDALQEILARAFQEKQEQELMALRRQAEERAVAAQQQQADQFNRRQSLDELQHADVVARQTRLDDAALSEKRNVQGTRTMMGDFLTRRAPGTPLSDQDRGTLETMAVTDNIQLPDSLMEKPKRTVVQTTGPGGKPVRRSVTEEELIAGVPEYVEPKTAPQGPQQPYQWVVRKGQQIYTNQVQPGDVPASRSGGGRSVTSGDAGRIADFDTSLDDVEVLDRELGTTGAGSQIGAMLPNVVTEFTGIGENSKQRQAVIDRVKQVIGKALEGGVLRKEDEAKYAKILPTIGDDPQVAKAKIAGLRKALEQRRATFIESLNDSGFDVSKFPAERTKKTPEAGAAPKRVYYDTNGKPMSR
jgi:hypothetical protein